MKKLSIVLIAISIIGAISIPLGNPRFLVISLSLEVLYIALAILSFKYRYIAIPSIILAIIVITVNTLSSVHTNIILSLNPLPNAILLIIGAYILQIMLIVTSIASLRE
ncbi:MAG: hypothetical protein QW416_05865 [Candidatus Nitrosocaldaceae archaeon]